MRYKKRKIDFEKLSETHLELSKYFKSNPEQNEWIYRLNSLPIDKRELFIEYICYNCNAKELSKKYKCSTSTMSYLINNIKKELRK